MGKNLKGKELGKGLAQRKDGRYSARFVRKNGKRVEKYFDRLPDAKNWLADAQYEDRHDMTVSTYDCEMTVDDWFDCWIDNMVVGLAPDTIKNYKDRYQNNIKPVIGSKKIRDIKPIHCKAVLNKMEHRYAGSTIMLTRITMGTIFKSALKNGIINKYPLDGVQCNTQVKAIDKIKFLKVDEQQKLLAAAVNSEKYYQYQLVLETGLRTGELMGLTWDAVDWENRTLTISKTLQSGYNCGSWRAGSLKTMSSYRTIPLTQKAYDVLSDVFCDRTTRNQSEKLSTSLMYVDRRSGVKMRLNMKDLIFINPRTGMPDSNSAYNSHLYTLCDRAGIHRICMHGLRHTYATRAIEYGVQPKALQKLLGHSSIKTTMDLYVHSSDEYLRRSVDIFEQKAH